MDVHAKSAENGVHKGYIPEDHRLSKVAGNKEKLVKEELSVASSLNNGATSRTLHLGKEDILYSYPNICLDQEETPLEEMNRDFNREFSCYLHKTDEDSYVVMYRPAGEEGSLQPLRVI
jgi:hypothetical protein